jgi:hypothetical protein
LPDRESARLRSAGAAISARLTGGNTLFMNDFQAA